MSYSQHCSWVNFSRLTSPSRQISTGTSSVWGNVKNYWLTLMNVNSEIVFFFPLALWRLPWHTSIVNVNMQIRRLTYMRLAPQGKDMRWLCVRESSCEITAILLYFRKACNEQTKLRMLTVKNANYTRSCPHKQYAPSGSTLFTQRCGNDTLLTYKTPWEDCVWKVD